MATPVVRGLGYALAALVSVVAVVAYASRPPAIRSAGAPVRALTASYNASGHDLFAQFAAESPGNIVLSPYSIGTAMAMIMSGARGDTATEMATALRHTLPRNEIDAANGDLLALFDGYDRRFWQIWPSVQLKTANALMVLKRGHDIVSPRYAALLHDKYRTQLFRDAGLAEVNGWVRRQTEGKIEKIVDEILPGEVLAILNAVYFKATWQSGFRRSDTRDADSKSLDPSRPGCRPCTRRAISPC